MLNRFAKRARHGFTLVEIMIVVLIIGILLAIAIPNFLNARKKAQAKSCQGNLRQIDNAKQQWAIDQKKGATDSPAAADITPTYVKNTPACPAGGTYTYGAVQTDPSCSFVATDTDHKLPL
jgi:prepilin-type N-terminal cleavage/methylation domain-containing protein